MLDKIRSVWKFGLVTVLALALVACASRPSDDEPEALAEWEEINDPYEPFNRAMFDVNLTLDRWLFRPAAEGYRWLLPDFLRDAIHNVLANAGEPVNFFNSLLQGDFDRAGTALGRLAINTTIGVGGMFDVAGSEFDLQPIDEDFGQTLAVWGAEGDGGYLMLPILGPSSVRDGAGRGVDIFLNPLTYVLANSSDGDWIALTIALVGGVDQRERTIEILDEIERTSVDLYAAIRSLYRQRRVDLINNGEPGVDVNPFFSDSLEYLDDSELTYVE